MLLDGLIALKFKANELPEGPKYWLKEDFAFDASVPHWCLLLLFGFDVFEKWPSISCLRNLDSRLVFFFF